MNENPDFYLTCTGEYNFLFNVRSCYIERRITAINRAEGYLLVKVTPPIKPYGGGKDLELIVLSIHYADSTLFPINEWPLHVYVCRAVNEEIFETGKADGKDLSIELWAALYRTYDEAKAETDKYEEQLKRFGTYETI